MDPTRGLEGNTRRAIDIHKDDAIEEAAFKELIRAAVGCGASAGVTTTRARKCNMFVGTAPQQVSRRTLAGGGAIRSVS